MLLASASCLVCAFTAPPPIARRSAPVMSFDRREALQFSLLAAVASPLACSAAVTADGGNQAIDNAAMRFNGQNLGYVGTQKSQSIDDTEAAMAKIAQKNREKQAELERKRLEYLAGPAEKTDEELAAQQQQSKNLILGIAAGGTLASGAFIIPNLRRLGTKIASGGADRGYDTIPDKKVKKAAKRGRGKNVEPELVDNPPFGGLFRRK